MVTGTYYSSHNYLVSLSKSYLRYLYYIYYTRINIVKKIYNISIK